MPYANHSTAQFIEHWNNSQVSYSIHISNLQTRHTFLNQKVISSLPNATILWWSWESAEIFQGGNVSILLIVFKLQCKWTSTKRFTFFRPQRKFPMKARAPFACFWNCIQVELYSCLRKGRTFCHPLQLLMNWGSLSSNIIIIVNYRQLSLKWSWAIHSCVCGIHVSLCELNLTSQNLVSNVFYTLAIRNAFSFHELVNVHFSSTFWA